MGLRESFALFADDLRPELGGKFSLMGIYSSDIILPGPAPQILPKFVIFVNTIFDISEAPGEITYSIQVPPNGEEMFSTTIKVDVPDDLLTGVSGAEKLFSRQTFPFGNFLLPAAGYIEVYVASFGKKMRAGRLMIKFLETEATTSPTS